MARRSTFAATIAESNSSTRFESMNLSHSRRTLTTIQCLTHSTHTRSTIAKICQCPPQSLQKYFCSMCPRLESDKPVDWPKCGMALKCNPAWSRRRRPRRFYTCPMHPQIRQDHPGDCPICGMRLEPMAVTPIKDDEENSELRDMTKWPAIENLVQLVCW